MRQLNIKVLPEKREKIASVLEKLGAKNIVEINTNEYVFFEFYLDNRKVQDFFGMDEAEDAEIMLNPHGVLPLHPPAHEAPDQVTDVSMRSPVEIFMSSLQSIGSWGSLVAYSVASAVVAFTGLYTDVMYLLTASMLIAPFAGPVMNAALAAAAGEPKLLGSSLLRYAVSIGISVAVSFLICVLLDVDVLPPLASSLSKLSRINLLLPLFAGFAGAVSIINSERNNLVSGAGVGILVAASLAPPSVILGVTLYMGGNDALLVNLYKLLLQVLGIQFSASLVFRYWGKISTHGVRFHKGNNGVFMGSLALSLVLFTIMGYFQFNNRPLFQRSTLAYEIQKTSTHFFKDQKNMQVIDLRINVTGEKSDSKNIAYCEAVLFSKDNQPEPEDSFRKDYLKRLTEEYPNLLFVAKVSLVPEK